MLDIHLQIINDCVFVIIFCNDLWQRHEICPKAKTWFEILDILSSSWRSSDGVIVGKYFASFTINLITFYILLVKVDLKGPSDPQMSSLPQCQMSRQGTGPRPGAGPCRQTCARTPGGSCWLVELFRDSYRAGPCPTPPVLRAPGGGHHHSSYLQLSSEL